MPASEEDPVADDRARSLPLRRAPRRGRAFPGLTRELAGLRKWLSSELPACEARGDVLLVATELAGNAIAHTASGCGGWFTVELRWLGRTVRVMVGDGGSSTEPKVIDEPDAERGRGLLLVRELSERTGVDGDCRGRRVWAEVAWDGRAPAWSGRAGRAPGPDGDSGSARALAVTAADGPRDTPGPIGAGRVARHGRI